MSDIRRCDWVSLKPTVFGWGISDVRYNIYKTEEMPKINGKRNQKILWCCPYYQDWSGMIERCYSPKYQARQPTYVGCMIEEQWKYLSNFIEWVDSQPNRDWQNFPLDKDFLGRGDKLYSPNTCAYIPKTLNNFINDRINHRGNFMLGVSTSCSKPNPYQARCSNPFTRRVDYLGVFPTEMDAHLAWLNKKRAHATVLAKGQTDPRIAEALINMYL